MRYTLRSEIPNFRQNFWWKCT